LDFFPQYLVNKHVRSGNAVLIDPLKKMEQILIASSNEISFYEDKKEQKKQKRKTSKDLEDEDLGLNMA